MTNPALTDLTYGELLDHLRKDLLLDARTDLQPGTVLASLIDNNGQAAFLQLPRSERLEMDAGTNAGVVFAAANSSANLSVTHSLGRVPLFVVVSTTITSAIPLVVLSQTSTTFTVRGDYWAAITGLFPFDWIALG